MRAWRSHVAMHVAKGWPYAGNGPARDGLPCGPGGERDAGGGGDSLERGHAEARARHPDFDWSNYPEPDDDCFLQVKVFSASNDADQSAYHMGGTTEAVYRALKISLPWITETIRISDQWYIPS